MSDPKVEYHFSPPAPATVVTMTGEALAIQLAQARAQEREQCIEIVRNLQPKYSKYGQPTRREYLEALEDRRYLPKEN
jgi:hypothetical protein